MITIFKTCPDGLMELSDFEPGCWMNLTAPASAEIKELAQRFSLPIDFLTDPLDVDERARVELEDDIVLLILRTPHRDTENGDVPFSTLPIGVILGSDFVLTVCGRHNDVLAAFLEGKVKRLSTSQRNRFAFHLFRRTALLYLAYLREINKRTDAAEDALQRAMRNEELVKLLNLQKSLTFFTTSLKSNDIMMEKLQRSNILKMDSDDRDMLEDVIIEHKQAIETASIYSNILSGLMDAFASVISNNLNVVMKALTVITILMTIPTLVASIYGMNIELPFQDSPYAFLLTMAASLTLSIAGVLLFFRRRWL